MSKLEDLKNKLYKIWAGEYKEDGYSEGISDAKNFKPRNTLKAFKKINPINYVWNFNKSIESFQEGYNEGYSDGLKVKHGVFSCLNKNSGGNTMQFDVKSYEIALKILKDMKSQLLALKGELGVIDKKYIDSIAIAKANGWMQNYISSLEERYNIRQETIKNLEKVIDKFLLEVDNHIKFTEDLIETSRNNNHP